MQFLYTSSALSLNELKALYSRVLYILLHSRDTLWVLQLID